MEILGLCSDGEEQSVIIVQLDRGTSSCFCPLRTAEAAREKGDESSALGVVRPCVNVSFVHPNYRCYANEDPDFWRVLCVRAGIWTCSGLPRQVVECRNRTGRLGEITAKGAVVGG